MTVYFARTDHIYPPYSDWYRLIELSGFETCNVGDIDVESDHTYIVNHFAAVQLPGNHIPATARIILWQFEWVAPDRYDQYPANIREVWASDKWYADSVNAKYVLMGSHPDLACGGDVKDGYYDIALMMYREPHRRLHIINRLHGLSLSIAPNAWDEARHQYLSQSACMVHIHQHDAYPTIAPLRMALAAAYRLPVITETPKDRGLFGYTHLLNSDYKNLPEFTEMWIHRNGVHAMRDYGYALHGLLCQQQTFRKCVEDAL